ncbi:MAG: ASCH domain-containing protein [Negativicutes bacterium]|nr:ASCH domain-containing protein [Negativicutes bacterium]
MYALNFISPHNEKLLTARQKTATIRPGDISGIYSENSIVWITFGKKFGPKKKLYQAIIDRTLIKRFSDLTKADLNHQNPELTSVEELIELFEDIYEKKLNIDDLVTIIHFSEVKE